MLPDRAHQRPVTTANTLDVVEAPTRGGPVADMTASYVPLAGNGFDIESTAGVIDGVGSAAGLRPKVGFADDLHRLLRRQHPRGDPSRIMASPAAAPRQEAGLTEVGLHTSIDTNHLGGTTVECAAECRLASSRYPVA
jgi:hypothetical protein